MNEMANLNFSRTKTMFDFISESMFEIIASIDELWTRRNPRYTSGNYLIFLDLDKSCGFMCDFLVYREISEDIFSAKIERLFSDYSTTTLFSQTVSEILETLYKKHEVDYIYRAVNDDTKLARFFKLLLKQKLVRDKEIVRIFKNSTDAPSLSAFEYLIRNYFTGLNAFDRAVNLSNLISNINENDSLSSSLNFSFSFSSKKYISKVSLCSNNPYLTFAFTLFDNTGKTIFSRDITIRKYSAWIPLKFHNDRENKNKNSSQQVITIEFGLAAFQSLDSIDERQELSQMSYQILDTALSQVKNQKEFQAFLSQIFSEIDTDKDLVKKLEDFRKAKSILNFI